MTVARANPHQDMQLTGTDTTQTHADNNTSV